jgi:hypothetical protein
MKQPSRKPIETPFDTIWFIFLSTITFGSICAAFAVAVCFVANLELTRLDTSILVALIVGLCGSAILLFSALYLVWCHLRYGKLVLAISYTIFDLFILVIGIAILAMEPSDLLRQIGRMWTDESESSILLFLEEQFNCCGFNQVPLHDCKGRTQSCFNVFDSVLSRFGVLIGGTLIGVFLLLLVCIVISYIRALKKPPPVSGILRGQEMNSLQERLTGESVTWF